MPSDAESLSAKVQSCFRQLTTAAADLNVVSDELGKSITELDNSLKKLNLGISVWVSFASNDQTNGDWISDEIGYAKVNGKWGIAIRIVTGNYGWGEDQVREEYVFNEAPRAMRLRAISKIPELLQKLSEKAAEMTKRLKEKLSDAQAVSQAVKEVSAAPRTARVVLKNDSDARVTIDKIKITPAEES